MVLFAATAVNTMSFKNRDDVLPRFRNTACPTEHNAYSVCIEVDFQDGGKDDLLLLNESPISPIILKGHLESTPSVTVVVILADEDNPTSNTIAFDNERLSWCSKFSVDIKTGETKCIELDYPTTNDEANDEEEMNSSKESERSLLEQTLNPRAVDAAGYKLNLVVYYDDAFYQKFNYRSQTRIQAIMALVAEQYSETSFKTKIDISLRDIKYARGDSWNRPWENLKTTGRIFQELSYIAKTSNVDANVYVFLTVDPSQSFYGYSNIGSLCDQSKDKRFNIIRYTENDAMTALTVAHEMAHNLGIKHDCINYVCAYDNNPSYVGARDHDGKDCYGYMDYRPDTKGWSDCSTSDFADYVNSQTSYCLERINEWSTDTTDQEVGCRDMLPYDYNESKCPWGVVTCPEWAQYNYCYNDWSSVRQCVPYSAGKIKDYCKLSCNSCETEACKKFQLTSTGGASYYHGNKLGLYVREEKLTNGRVAYYNGEKGMYLYFVNSNEVQYWMVGPTKGQESGGIINTSCNTIEHPANGNCNYGWKYYSGGWKQDNTIRLVCNSW